MLVYDVLCVGSATLDNFLTVDTPLNKVHLGDKVLVNSMKKHSGGGATNAAAALSKMHLRVKILTKLGRDHDASFILNELKQYKIKNICQRRSKKNTDFSTIISSTKSKDRIIYVHKGASQDLNTNDYSKSQLRAKWIYLSSLVGKSFSVAKDVANYALNNHIPLMFNISSYLAEKGPKYLSPILKATTILILNKEEAQTLIRSKTLSNNIKIILKEIHKLGPKIIVITNGQNKIYAYDHHLIYSLQPPEIKVVHTAGAGDAFASGLLAGVMKKFSLEDSLKIGLVNSMSVIEHIGTKNKLLTKQEAIKHIKKYKLRVVKNVS